MTGLHQDGRSRRYRCMRRFKGGDCDCRRVGADLLELTVRTHLITLMSDPDKLSEAMHAWLEPEPVTAVTTAEDLDARIQAAEAKRTNIILASASLGPEAIKDAVQQVELELDTLRRRRELRQSALDQRDRAQALIPQFMEYVEKMVTLDAQGMRSLLALMDVRVILTGWVEDYKPPTGGLLFPPWPYTWRIEGNLLLPESGDAPASGPKMSPRRPPVISMTAKASW
jgi:hypothetical protein